MAEFSGIDLHDLIAKQHGDDPEYMRHLIRSLDRVLAKNLGIAVYEAEVPINDDKPTYQFLSFGPRDSEAHTVAADPIQLPQTRSDVAGRWGLLGYYQGEPGSIEDGQARPKFGDDYLAKRKAEMAAKRGERGPRIRPEWVDNVIEQWGEPNVEPPQKGDLNTRTGKPRTVDGVTMPGVGGSSVLRRAWVWFPGGVNHWVHIDQSGGHYVVEAGSHKSDAHTASARVVFRSEPTDEEMRALTRLGWGMAAIEAVKA